MGGYLAFALIGLGAGAVYSGLAIGLMVTYKPGSTDQLDRLSAS